MSDLLDSIYAGEAETLTFDFVDALGAETIATQAVAVSVVTGTDPAPDDIKDGASTEVDGVVFQPVKPLVDNVAYLFVCTVTTTGTPARTIKLDSILPVLAMPVEGPGDVDTYCTKDDLIRRFGATELAQLTDESSANNVDTVDVELACQEATSLINLYLAPRYLLPLTDADLEPIVPRIIRKWACDIARYHLHGDRVNEGDAVHTHYTEAITMLEKVALGDIELPDTEGLTLLEAGGYGVAVKTSEQVFTDELLSFMP